MANKLGAAFLRCSLGPLNYAGGCILAGKIPEGLNELGADNLHGGFKRGVEEAAKHVGVGARDVERLLPMGDVQAASAVLDAAQKGAVEAWRMHAGHLGGMMKGIADLTVDGRAPDVSQFLQRLSYKVVRDPPLSEPLLALSKAVATWLDLVEHCSDLLADGGVLAKAYRRRRQHQVAAVAALVVAAASGLVAVLWLRAVRARVDTALALIDPCAAATIAPDDLERASTEQKQRAADRGAACEEGKKRAEQARVEAQQREDKARAEEAARKDHADRCDALATHVAGGQLAGADDAVAGGKSALLGRVARLALDRADLLETELPCGDTPAGAKLADAFAAAVAASTGAWSRADDVGERARTALLARKDALPGSPKQVLAQHAEVVAKKALVSHDTGAVDRAAALCRLKDELGIRGGKYCATVYAVSGKR
jgi:hypothetical protein